MTSAYSPTTSPPSAPLCCRPQSCQNRDCQWYSTTCQRYGAATGELQGNSGRATAWHSLCTSVEARACLGASRTELCLPPLYAQGAQAGEQKLEIAPAQQQPEQAAEPQGMDIGEPPANEAADAAASAAQELLGQSRQVLIDITSNQNRPTQADSSTSAGRRGSRGGSDLQTNGSCQKASSAGNSNKGLRQFALLVCEQVSCDHPPAQRQMPTSLIPYSDRQQRGQLADIRSWRLWWCVFRFGRRAAPHTTR